MGIWIKETDVLIEVEDVGMGKTLDIFGKRDDLLEVLILRRGEDRVIDDYAVDRAVGIGGYDGFFEEWWSGGLECEVDATIDEFSKGNLRFCDA